ncbi:type II toxin-antitoxin system ParD family antitoxin [Providencia stuartii]|uniref:type II toxin-antitoxin system ParD family antitoxin n=1 Tax=Providencia stuartii TaxID=588 RepID=UPI0018C7FEAA|nr:type II toxin-antitoxin system ParD family antitoxin [Providencia stuartii]EMD1718312.1 type II toxin-antitoxin system ParD family antitoxin [Providencia stuartii]MBG5908710.1 type II toxin-antitoxin system ParD family antitoxin [Providencia stuartii]WAZ75317.1 type II toxin-antitoxin system ParD family antitoxin [Providencia stuartii]HAU5734366.1 type II toxin-antitoxin system ParD family antitoxin [Providencia stuartii]HAU5775323.1 type II toxin-antitoxin system ParD family antitoxin [Pro
MSTSVALSPYFEEFIQSQIKSGRYNNTSEVIRAGLRALEEQENQLKLAALQTAIVDGINSGESKDASAVFSRLSSKYATLTEDNGSK